MNEQAAGPTCRWPGGAGDQSGFPDPEQDLAPEAGVESAEMVVAGGCFWCVDAVFRRVVGVLASECGYCGGSAATANYMRVCGGDTGHAEAVRLRYDPQQISFGALLKIFFSVAHDPTQRDRQGHDVGPQYRSAVFYADEAQRAVAAAYIDQLDAAGIFPAPIATTLEPLEAFHPAEPEHQAYAERHPDAGYIRIVAQPKLEKLGKAFATQLRG
ncbi:peptide-methionine (S)-S-oxide reductase MsrA [Algiphilus aromaticivorans]|uniref:peptide-methionine (S)-S-oxide reductase MsrA n=1 Tax=Algiphilus aromaticivorans TaxID=382454 RepID=UPI0005C25153|nr:peptide-methionine (S)-S-oxide reductase MsrA [Algiphilus aromaticivorans]